MLNIICSKFCIFNHSEYPIDLGRAKDLVEYFDEKYLQVINLLQIKDFPKKVYIFTRKEDRPPSKYDNDKIQFTPHMENKNCITAGNRGFLIHEAAHIAQDYDPDVYRKNWWIAEAIADYVRTKLGWDNSDNPLEYPCKKHSNLGCSKCDADFLFWIEKKYVDNNFIVDLNRALQGKQDVENFFKNRFEKDLYGLHQEYQGLKK